MPRQTTSPGPVRQPSAATRFPFDGEYQKALMRLLCEDEAFAYAVGKYLKPEHFENGVLVWAYALARRYFAEYGVMPSVRVLINETRKLSPELQSLYCTVMTQVEQIQIRDATWLRDNVLEFVKLNIFVEGFHSSRDLFNDGKTTQAYDRLARKMEEIHQISWEMVDRSFHFADWRRRHLDRSNRAEDDDDVPTLIPWLDDVLGGGLSKGEMGIWLAYYKVGKSTLLTNLGLRAVRGGMKKVLHIVLEGSREVIENKYDAAFNELAYWDVKRGNLDSERVREIYENYQIYSRNLVIRAFTDRWDCSVLDIDAEIKELKAYFGFDPDLLVVDYGDLLHGHRGGYKSIYEDQRDAFRDLKTMANKGYALWTASQAQRPEKGAEDKQHVVKARQAADSIGKVHVGDFIGSINATKEEQKAGILRLYAELYRQNEADKIFALRADLSKSIIYTEAPPEALTGPTDSGEVFGYSQSRMPV